MERARPSFWNSIRVFQVETKSPSYCVGSGQWIRNRSIVVEAEVGERPVERARGPSSGSWKPLLSLLVMNSSSRGMPEARIASPTPFSLPYISAVSMCR